MKHLVKRDMPGIMNWNDGNVSGLDLLMKFIAKLLHESCSESASLYVGDLLIEIARKAGDRIHSVLPEVLKAVIYRLGVASTPSFIQTLVLVFAFFMQTQSNTVMSFLQSIQVNGKDGLSLLMTIWLENHDSFHGIHAIKLR